jgi:hypothetical protein
MRKSQSPANHLPFAAFKGSSARTGAKGECGRGLLFLQEAKRLRSAYGWNCLPLRNRGLQKAPACGWKRYQTVRPSDEETAQKFSAPALTGLAVVTGAISDSLAVFDFDTEAGYLEWASAHPEAAASLPTARTHRGYHVYCRLPAGFLCYQRKAPFPGQVIADSAHYVALPPSLHPEGSVYQWLQSPGAAIPLLEDPVSLGLLPPIPSPLLPLPAKRIRSCVRLAINKTEQVDVLIAAAVERTLPREEGQRHGCLFRLERELKAIPSLASLEAEALEPVVREWFERCRSVVRDQRWWETWRDFCSGWQRVRCAAGARVEDLRRWLEETVPFDPWQTAEEKEVRCRLRLELACEHLQAMCGGERFTLAVSTASTIIGLEKNAVGRLMRDFEACGRLERVGEHDRLKRLAREWRYRGSGLRQEGEGND